MFKNKSIQPHSSYQPEISFIMLVREDYLKIIEEIRNIEKASLDEYIIKKLVPLKDENQFFVETLIKDINYILDGIDKPGDNDLIFEDGDIVIEDGDFKLTGYQTRLHNILNWLHGELMEKNILTWESKLNAENLKLNALKGAIKEIDISTFFEMPITKSTYTIEYKEQLDQIRRSIKKERQENYDYPKSKMKIFFLRLFDLDNWNFKPTFFGLEFDVFKFLRRVKR